MPNNPNAKDNLIPVKKGEVRNPNGRPKGSKNFSTMVKEVIANEAYLQKVIKNSKSKPFWFDETKPSTGAYAYITAVMVKAMSGDVQAAEWLTRRGYGIEFEEEQQEHNTLIFINEVPNRQEKRRTIDAEGIDGDL